MTIDSAPVAVAGVKRKRADEDAEQRAPLGVGVPLTLDEEQALLQAFVVRILDLSAELGFPPDVTATAAAFFRRFYTVRSPRDVWPVDAMHTAIFLALKTEACPYTELDGFSRRLAHARKLAFISVVVVRCMWARSSIGTAPLRTHAQLT